MQWCAAGGFSCDFIMTLGPKRNFFIDTWTFGQRSASSLVSGDVHDPDRDPQRHNQVVQPFCAISEADVSVRSVRSGWVLATPWRRLRFIIILILPFSEFFLASLSSPALVVSHSFD